MKLAYWLCFGAVTFSAIEVSIADWKLAKLSPWMLTLFYGLGVATCAVISLFFGKEEVKFPQGSQWFFVALMVGAAFAGCLCHFGALNNESGAIALTMFYALMPVVASIFTAFTKGELPSLRTCLAWVVAVLALYLVSTEK